LGDGVTCTSEDACADANYFDITYTFSKSSEAAGNKNADPPADQSVLTVRDTTGTLGDGNRNIGPGSAVVRFENVDGEPGSKGYLLSFEISIDFTIAPVTTNLVATAGNNYKDGPCSSAAVGTISGEKLVWSDFSGTAQGTSDAPNLHGYVSKGTLTCKNATLCNERLGAPPQGTTPSERGPYDIRFEPWQLSDGVSTFFMPLSVVEKNSTSTTSIQLYGVESARECKSIEACE
jgi:hypothetical protein